MIFQVAAGQVLDDDAELCAGEDDFAEQHQIWVIQEPVLYDFVEHILAYQGWALQETRLCCQLRWDVMITSIMMQHINVQRSSFDPTFLIYFTAATSPPTSSILTVPKAPASISDKLLLRDVLANSCLDMPCAEDSAVGAGDGQYYPHPLVCLLASFRHANLAECSFIPLNVKPKLAQAHQDAALTGLKAQPKAQRTELAGGPLPPYR